MDIPLCHPSSHANCASRLTLALGLYTVTEDISNLIQTKTNKPFTHLCLQIFNSLCALLAKEIRGLWCNPGISRSPACLTQACPSAALLTPFLSLERSLVQHWVCLYIPMPTALLYCGFALSISSASYEQAGTSPRSCPSYEHIILRPSTLYSSWCTTGDLLPYRKFPILTYSFHYAFIFTKSKPYPSQRACWLKPPASLEVSSTKYLTCVPSRSFPFSLLAELPA